MEVEERGGDTERMVAVVGAAGAGGGIFKTTAATTSACFPCNIQQVCTVIVTYYCYIFAI